MTAFPPWDQTPALETGWPEGQGPVSRGAPLVTWIYGLLGLIPFLAGATETWLFSGLAALPGRLELLTYGALILSFLGGGRWGLEIGRTHVRPGTITASMLPTIFAFVLLVGGGVAFVRWRLTLLAAGFMAQWLWDVISKGPPRWYSPLRHVLTAGAVACLLAGAASPGV